jgi:beta-galactosidase
VELFINGQSFGKKSKSNDALHICWRVPFIPGSLKTVAYKDGKVSMEKEIKTSDSPAKLILTPDRNIIKADGEDLSFIKVTVIDRDGNKVPYADNLINFKIDGNARIVGVDNGCQTNHQSFKADYCNAFHGNCLVVVQSLKAKGKVKITGFSQGLEPCTVIIQAQ